MRRWNGWGEQGTSYHFPKSAADYLEQLIGKGERIPDAALEAVVEQVPATRLPIHPLINDDPFERLMHARGQSLPDWVALRSGQIAGFPDGVAYPKDKHEVRQLLKLCQEAGVRIVPYGGGTSVVGHINPQGGNTPVLTIDLSLMSNLTEMDETSQLATIGAGANGPQVESQLKAHGYTLGHFPQSFELSTLGGWIATRSSGQQSYCYGRIEDLFSGGHVETMLGPLELPTHPASAAGPDLRQLFLGSEGRLGIITHAVMRVRPIPEVEHFQAIFFPDWESGMNAVREIAQEQLMISMARLSDAQETVTTLALSGMEALVSWADRGLRLIGHGDERCLFIYGLTGNKNETRLAGRRVRNIARRYQGFYTGQIIGKIWQKSRFSTPYLRNTLWERGYALDTLETAVPWSQVSKMAEGLKNSIRKSLEQNGERALVFSHLSHVYADGASIYVTYLFRRTEDPDEILERWQGMKDSASRFLVENGGTISHQHGVGVDHAPYLEGEKGVIGMAILGSVTKFMDPDGLLNPGKLLD